MLKGTGTNDVLLEQLVLFRFISKSLILYVKNDK